MDITVNVSVNSVTVPSAFDAGDWGLAQGSGASQLNVTITTLPSNGGSAITDIEYDIDGSGSWASLPSYAGTGVYTITMAAPSTSYDLRLRAVNVAGASTASAAKTATSGATGSASANDDARLAETWTRHDGTGVGPQTTPGVSLATFVAQAGVSQSGSKITVSGDNITAEGVIFGAVEIDADGDNFRMSGCSLTAPSSASSGDQRCVRLNGANPTIEYNAFTGSVNCQMVTSHDATGTITIQYNDFTNMVGNDPIKGPDPGSTLDVLYNRFNGFSITGGSHLDIVDLRGADPGSRIIGNIVIADLVAGGPAGGGNTVNDMVRCATSDGHGGTGAGVIIEDNIWVGLDDSGGQAAMMQHNTTDVSGTGVVSFNNLFDLRVGHSAYNFGESGTGAYNRVDDYEARTFDYAASVIAGELVIGSNHPFGRLSDMPAASPQTMDAPVITGGSGQISWADNRRPWNNRSLITQYDLRWSTDGSTWTTVTDVSLFADSLTGLSPGSGYRIQFRGVNAQGAGAWSASSNIEPVS